MCLDFPVTHPCCLRIWTLDSQFPRTLLPTILRGDQRLCLGDPSNIIASCFLHLHGYSPESTYLELITSKSSSVWLQPPLIPLSHSIQTCPLAPERPSVSPTLSVPTREGRLPFPGSLNPTGIHFDYTLTSAQFLSLWTYLYVVSYNNLENVPSWYRLPNAYLLTRIPYQLMLRKCLPCSRHCSKHFNILTHWIHTTVQGDGDI